MRYGWSSFQLGPLLTVLGGSSMRLIIPCLTVPLFVLLAQPSAAQNQDEAAKARRIAEIQRQIQELQDTIAKLQAKLRTLQPVAKPGPPNLSPDDKLGQGVIKSLNDQGNGFDLVSGGPMDDKRLILLATGARIMFPNKQ